jgi:hypothetical protein
MSSLFGLIGEVLHGVSAGQSFLPGHGMWGARHPVSTAGGSSGFHSPAG